MIKIRNWITASLVAVSVLFVSFPMPVHATGSLLEQIKQAEEQKNQIEQQKKQVEEERNNKKGELNQLKFEQGTLKTQLDGFNSDLEEANAALLETQGKITDKEAEIEETKEELAEAKATETSQYEAMKKRIQAAYEQPDNMFLEILFSSDDFSSFLNFTDYFMMLSEYDEKMLEKYTEAKQAVELEELTLENELAELDLLEEQNKADQERISDLIKTTSEFVAEYQVQINGANNELAAIEADIAAKEAEIAEQEADIEALKKKYDEEVRLSQIAANSAWRDISEVTFSESDRQYIASIIYCEAGGEPYEGKLAVGAVVINRVLSSKYPDNVFDVIHQPYQFSPVLSGRYDQVLSQGRANADCYRAADEAMSGMTNVDNCLYFRTPVPDKTPRYVIGNHIFY